MARIIFNPVAVTDFGQHRQVIIGAPAQAVGLEQFARFFKTGHLLFHFGADIGHRPRQFGRGGDKVFGREEPNLVGFGQNHAAGRV